MIQPQEKQQLAKNPPREIVFLVDVSGSMRLNAGKDVDPNGPQDPSKPSRMDIAKEELAKIVRAFPDGKLADYKVMLREAFKTESHAAAGYKKILALPGIDSELYDAIEQISFEEERSIEELSQLLD